MKTSTALKRVAQVLARVQNPSKDTSCLIMWFNEEYGYINKLYYDRLSEDKKKWIDNFISRRNDMKLISDEDFTDISIFSSYYTATGDPHPWA